MGSFHLSRRPWSHLQLLTAVLALFLLTFGCDSGGSSMPPEPEPGGEEPAASVQLTAENDGEEVDLSWTAENVEAADHYRIYRGGEADFDTTGTFYASVTDTTAYRDTSVQVDQLYHYRVAAIGDEGATAALSPSDYARPEDVTAPKAPTNAEGAGGFYKGTLTWDPVAADDLGGYRVYRSTESFMDVSQAELLTTSSLDTTGYVDDSAIDRTRYFYRVTAVDESRNESSPSSEVAITPTFSGDPMRGEALFREACAQCHTVQDGWDLAAFAFPDTTIHRRATKHITEQEAFDIIKFIRSKDTEPLPGVERGVSEVPPFQPGGRVLDSDREFAMEVFGQDAWPKDLTEDELLSLNPQALPVPLEMPRWSVEANAQDWLPEAPLPERVQNASGFRSALNRYRSSPSDENLVRVARAFDRTLTEGEKFPGEHGRTGREAFWESFEMYRWTSTLIGAHFLRSGDTEMPSTVDGYPVEDRHFSPVSPWWRVGDIMRRFVAFRDDAPDEVFRIASRWLYLSWSFRQDVVGFEQKYLSLALDRGLGLKRVSAFSLAYGIVSGAPNNHHLYEDLIAVHRHTPETWQGDLMIFLLEHLIKRWESGDRLDPDHQREFARRGVREGVNNILESNRRLTEAQRERIQTLRDKLLNLLGE